MAEPLVNLFRCLGSLVGLLVWASLAPFEALGWWAGWFGDKIYQPEIEVPPLVRPSPAEVDNYIVFLSGISRVSGEPLSRREQNFLRDLASAMPCSVVIDNIFPIR
ncbi:MAG: hypothetical protein R2856_08790 [Caldilineaceae bacterium]